MVHHLHYQNYEIDYIFDPTELIEIKNILNIFFDL